MLVERDSNHPSIDTVGNSCGKLSPNNVARKKLYFTIGNTSKPLSDNIHNTECIGQSSVGRQQFLRLQVKGSGAGEVE